MDGDEIILRLEDPVLARNLVAALQAYGFHPVDPGDGGFPGMPGMTSPSGIPIALPEGEVADGKILAQDLLKEMLKR